MNNTPVVEMTGIKKVFPGVRALSNVNFTLKQGEVNVLLGENGAGKSTLIKILSGVHKKDGGSIYINGKETEINSPHHAQNLGISTIYQEFNVVPDLSIAENIFLGRQPTKDKVLQLVDWKKMYKEAEELLHSLELDIDSRNKVRDLGVAEKQMVEIAKALSVKSKVLILDEPTAVLTAREIEKLFAVINNLKSQGVGIIYISHRLEEIQHIGDSVTVLRDGTLVGTIPAEKADIDTLIRMMVGRELKDKFPQREIEVGEEALRVEGLSRGNVLKDISFSLRKGEILGIAGLVGAGRTELGRAIFGADRISSGQLYIGGEKVQVKSPRDAIGKKICYLPEERKTNGLVLSMSVKDNITLASLGNICNGQIIRLREEKKTAEEFVNKLKVKTPDIERNVVYLSGGNQQKVVIAKWLCAKSDIFIFDEPTRGIDVGAKFEVYQLMNELVRHGAGIIMISSELPEVLGMSDRVIVMRKGEITGVFNKDEANQELILSRAWGQERLGISS